MLNEENLNQGTASPGDVEAQVNETPPEASAPPAPEVEPAKPKSKPDEESAKKSMENIKNVTMEYVTKAGGAAALLAFFSFVLMVQASVDKHKDRFRKNIFYGNLFGPVEPYGNLAISVAVINLAFAIAYLVMNKKQALSDKSKRVSVGIMWLFTTICVGVITFKEPYYFAGNGFFCAWGIFGALSSMLNSAFGEEVGKAKETFSALGFYAGPLLLVSVLELCAAIPFCRDGTCPRSIGFAVAVGSVSAFFCIIFAIMEKTSSISDKLRNIVAGFLCLWWLFGVMVCTIDAPFLFVGVGYCLVYAGFFISLLMFHHEMIQP